MEAQDGEASGSDSDSDTSSTSSKAADANGEKDQKLESALMPKALMKELKRFDSPHKWACLEGKMELGNDANNVRIMPHASADCWWTTYKGHKGCV